LLPVSHNREAIPASRHASLTAQPD